MLKYDLDPQMNIALTGKKKEREENELLQRRADVEGSGNSSSEEDSTEDDRPNTPPKRVIELVEYVNRIEAGKERNREVGPVWQGKLRNRVGGGVRKKI